MQSLFGVFFVFVNAICQSYRLAYQAPIAFHSTYLVLQLQHQVPSLLTAEQDLSQ